MSAAISRSDFPSPAVRTMKPPGMPGPVVLQDAPQPQALFVGGDLAGDAHVVDGRHVDDVPSGQRDVRSDAGALLAERLLGDLDQDFLPLLQQVGDGRSGASGGGAGGFHRLLARRDVRRLVMLPGFPAAGPRSLRRSLRETR